jgi:transmembrane sensor
VAEVNRYSRRKIVLEAPPGLAAQPVSGMFDTGDTDAFVVAVQDLFGLRRVATSGGDIHLAAPAPAPPA